MILWSFVKFQKYGKHLLHLKYNPLIKLGLRTQQNFSDSLPASFSRSNASQTPYQMIRQVYYGIISSTLASQISRKKTTPRAPMFSLFQGGVLLGLHLQRLTTENALGRAGVLSTDPPLATIIHQLNRA